MFLHAGARLRPSSARRLEQVERKVRRPPDARRPAWRAVAPTARGWNAGRKKRRAVLRDPRGGRVAGSQEENPVAGARRADRHGRPCRGPDTRHGRNTGLFRRPPVSVKSIWLRIPRRPRGTGTHPGCPARHDRNRSTCVFGRGWHPSGWARVDGRQGSRPQRSWLKPEKPGTGRYALLWRCVPVSDDGTGFFLPVRCRLELGAVGRLCCAGRTLRRVAAQADPLLCRCVTGSDAAPRRRGRRQRARAVAWPLGNRAIMAVMTL